MSRSTENGYRPEHEDRSKSENPHLRPLHQTLIDSYRPKIDGRVYSTSSRPPTDINTAALSMPETLSASMMERIMARHDAASNGLKRKAATPGVSIRPKRMRDNSGRPRATKPKRMVASAASKASKHRLSEVEEVATSKASKKARMSSDEAGCKPQESTKKRRKDDEDDDTDEDFPRPIQGKRLLRGGQGSKKTGSKSRQASNKNGKSNTDAPADDKIVHKTTTSPDSSALADVVSDGKVSTSSSSPDSSARADAVSGNHTSTSTPDSSTTVDTVSVDKTLTSKPDSSTAIEKLSGNHASTTASDSSTPVGAVSDKDTSKSGPDSSAQADAVSDANVPKSKKAVTKPVAQKATAKPSTKNKTKEEQAFLDGQKRFGSGTRGLKSSGKGVARTLTDAEKKIKQKEKEQARRDRGSSSSNTGREEVEPLMVKCPNEMERGMNGIINHGNNCFASVILQIFDAALQGHKIDALLGKLDEVETFDRPEVTPGDSKLSNSNSGASKANKGSKKKAKADELKPKLREAIRAAAKSGKLQQVSVSKHLRQLIDSMRGYIRGKNERYVSAFTFQQVFAYGRPDLPNASDREEMNGDTQEDCFEFYNNLLDLLGQDEYTANAAGLKELFEVVSKVTTRCTKCKHTSEARVDLANYVHVRVPDSDNLLAMQDLLSKTMTSKQEGKCSKCGNETLRMKTRWEALPPNLVIRLDRVGNDLKTKIKSPVAVPVNLRVEIDGVKKHYLTRAIVQHKGDTVQKGHYTMYRKRSAEFGWMSREDSRRAPDWYLLDDNEVIATPDYKVEDGKAGHTVMVLFKEVTAKEWEAAE